MKKTYIRGNPEMPFSEAVVVRGDTLYLSGRIGFKSGTTQVPETLEEEVHAVMQDVQAILSRANMALEDLVFLQVFSPDVANWQPFNAVYRTYFTGPMPPRSFIGSGPLLFGARFELQGIAVRAAVTDPSRED